MKGKGKDLLCVTEDIVAFKCKIQL